MDITENCFVAFNQMLVSNASGLLVLNKNELEADVIEAIYLVGEYKQQRYFVALLKSSFDTSKLPEHDLNIHLRASLSFVESDEHYSLVSCAAQLVTWHYSFKFCPRCASALQTHEQERAKVCNSCGHHQYPRISPCIIVLVRKGNQCLLAHASRFADGRYSTLAGFIEAGESAEQAVHREIMEEVGISVENITYCFSQSWPFPHSFMMGFMADYKSGEITPDNIEIDDANWFDVENLPVLPPKFTIARRLIDMFFDEVSEGTPIDSRLFFPTE